MSKHTPGPWSRVAILTGKYAGSTGIRPASGPAFCILPPGREDVQRANAKLIESAPRLLAALAALIAECDADHSSDPDSRSVEISRTSVEEARATLALVRE